MASAGLSKGTSHGTDTPLELASVFQDPAGLRIARFIVSEYLKADIQRSAARRPTPFPPNAFSSVSQTLRFDSSPEFRRMLEERLVFRETEPPVREYVGGGGFPQRSRDGYAMFRDSDAAPASSERNHQQTNLFARSFAHGAPHTTYSQLPNYNSFFGTSHGQACAASRPQLRTTKSQAELELDALFDQPDSQTRGIDSPYRVESPSGRASGPSSLHNSPQRRSNSDWLSARVPSLENDPLQLDRLDSNANPLNYTTQSSTPRRSYLSDSGYFSQSQTPSASFRQSVPLSNHISNRNGLPQPQRRSPPTIKSFLPVNKTPSRGDPGQDFTAHKSESSHKFFDNRGGAPQNGLAHYLAGLKSDNSSRHTHSQHNNTRTSTQELLLAPDPASRSFSRIQPSTNHPEHHPFDFNHHARVDNRHTEMNSSSAGSASKKRMSETNGTNDAPQAKRSKINDATTHHPETPSIPNPQSIEHLPQAREDASRLDTPLPPDSPSLSTATPPSPDLAQPQQAGTSPKLAKVTSTAKPASNKRKLNTDDNKPAKMLRAGSVDKPKRIPKVKVPKPEPAKYRMGQDLWMRILEFTPPQFLQKARCISKEFNHWIQTFNSVFVNLRMENYGPEMPGPPRGLTERQYNDLLGGKGCMEPGCPDTKASRTHWPWLKRLCWECWKGMIEREDRILKMNQTPHGRQVMQDLLKCIPVGMHDSFLKPHDFIENLDSRARGSPRLYRYHMKQDVENIIAKYDALTPPPFQENPEHSAAEKAAALAAYQAEKDGLDEKRKDFLAKGKELNDAHMKIVQKIESCIKKRREESAKPYNDNRNKRRALFTKRAGEDLPHIPTSFVQSTTAFKAATRIFRDGGSERGWQTLKPKIEKEYEKSKASSNGSANATTAIDSNNSAASVTEKDNRPSANPPQNETNSNLQPADDYTLEALRRHYDPPQMQHSSQQIQSDMPSLPDPTSSSFMSSTLDPGFSNISDGLLGMGYNTMGQTHQNQHSFGIAHSGQQGLSYANASPLFTRQQQHTNNFGSHSNYSSTSNWSSGLQPLAHNNTYQTPIQQSSLQGASRTQIPVDSLLNATPNAPQFHVDHTFQSWSQGLN